MTLLQAVSLADEYHQLLPNNILIAGSFDFSHYLTSGAADFHDIANLADVESFNFADIYNLDIDSRPGLAFFLDLLKDNGGQNFHLLEHSNSAKLAHQDILETTSYIDGYFTAGSATTSSVNTVLVLPAITVSDSVSVHLAVMIKVGRWNIWSGCFTARTVRLFLRMAIKIPYRPN